MVRQTHPSEMDVSMKRVLHAVLVVMFSPKNLVQDYELEATQSWDMPRGFGVVEM